MFNSIYSASVTPVQLLLMAAAALSSGIVFSWMMSFRVRANRRFFAVSSLLPFIVGLVLTFINGNIGAGIAFGGAGGPLGAGRVNSLKIRFPLVDGALPGHTVAA